MAGSELLGPLGAFKTNLLDLRQRRQEIISTNIANVDTPGYKANRLEFEAELRAAMPSMDELPMARTSSSHMPTPYGPHVEGELQTVENTLLKGDGNSVNLEQEMAQQSANQLLYNYAAQSLNGQINALRMAISGGDGSGR
ncbi:MAG: flagellar basal body rod protein FlgB [Magnetococcales bacterium]|nr:flagellar basal body rod protein FlgB [Magnetococcales bacterium]